MSHVTYTMKGNVRRDNFGRFIVDPCSSDNDHLINSVAKPGDDRARCRRLVEEAFENLEGLNGTVTITVDFKAEGEED
jgi:hypothetical protein